MYSKMWLLCFFVLILFLLSDQCVLAEEFSLEQKIEQIEKQMVVLEKKKVELKKNAKRHLDQAHRWQFQSELAVESRREYSVVAQCEDKISVIDIQIKDLMNQKKDLLRD